MSKKIVKVWGLILAIMLIASMLVPAAPALAVYGQQQWVEQTLPTNTSSVLLNGSDVTDIAAGTGVLYALDGTGTGNSVYQSTNGGDSWTRVTGTPAGTGLIAISVAPDNSSVIAATNGTTVYITSDSGATWSALPAMSGNWTSSVILDVAVAPARSGTLLGREYVIAVADPATGSANTSATQNGDVLIIGESASWVTVGPTGVGQITGTRDYVAVAVTSNFVGDRSVVAIGASATSGTTGTAGVVVQVINTASKAVQSTANLFTSTSTTTDFASGVNATSIARGSIALPSDFDATTTSGRRAYVGIASQTAQGDNDAYRVDDTASKSLGAVTSQGIYSVAYSGTVSAGTLFEGRIDTPEVKYSTDMTGGSPTWTTTKKLLPAGTTRTIVMTAPDFATTKKVYTGTTGTGSAFSVSTDGGISFNQESFIDNGVANAIGTIDSGPTLSSDGKTMYVVSRTGGKMSLWKSSTPTSATSWSQLYVATATKGGFTTGGDAWYLYDAAANGNIYRSADGGATFNSRLAPNSTFVISSLTFQDANIGWTCDSSGNIWKTTNGAFIWTGPVTANVGAVNGLGGGRTDELLVGGTGMIAISKDGGTTFTTYTFDSSVGYKITKDTNYATNNVLFISDNISNTANRFTVGTDAKPQNMLATPTGGEIIKGLNVRSGVLYVAYQTRVLRTTNPLDTIGTLSWTSMNTGMPSGFSIAALGSTKDVDTIVYLRQSSSIIAYQDMMATAKPVVISPADNGSVSVDPNTGYGQQFNIVLQAVGSGTGLADYFTFQIAEQAIGFTGATTSSAIQVTSPIAPQITSVAAFGAQTLIANRVYVYRVRAAHEISGENVTSPWSDTRTFTVAPGGKVEGTQFGPVLTGPAGGATNLSTTPGFSWAPIFGANKYRVVIATDGAMTKTVGGTPKDVTLPSYQPTPALAEGTTYFWSVQVIDPTPGPVSVGTFTTAPKAAPPVTAAPPVITMPPITIPPIVIPPQPAPTITIPPAPPAPAPITPAFIWAIIIIGAVLVIAVIVLIIRTRKTP